MKTKLTILSTLLMTMGLGTAAAYAGDSYERAAPDKGPAPQAQEVPAEDFSNTDLKKFAAVQEDLEGIRSQYSGELETTEDPDKAAQLQQEASQKMVQVVQDAGLDVETYSNIALALQSDAQLREKVKSMMN